MQSSTLRSEDIKRLAKEADFDLCGVTRAEYLPEGESHFREWLAAGYGDGLDYLHRNGEVRFDTSRLVEGARTVVVCGVNYKNIYSVAQDLADGVGIASYAMMRDYHKTIKRMLKRLQQALTTIYPSLTGRCFTDSAPLLEKHLAVQAGLGWIGRQSLLVTPQYSTFVLLGELVIDRDVDHYDVALADGNRCGECRRCVDSCPAGVINENRTIDTRGCVACRTIEHKESGSAPLSGWIFGCDTCQSCCPYNQSTPLSQCVDMQPILMRRSAEEWMQTTSEEFAQYAQGTSLKRSSLERIKHNISINIGANFE